MLETPKTNGVLGISCSRYVSKNASKNMRSCSQAAFAGFNKLAKFIAILEYMENDLRNITIYELYIPVFYFSMVEHRYLAGP